jgi:hypothetical protein
LLEGPCQLQDSEFVPLHETAAVKAGEKKPEVIRIRRQTPSGKTLKFDIQDRVPRPESKTWERVVAVVCSGKLWQFKKGYPFKVCFSPFYNSLIRIAVSTVLVESVFCTECNVRHLTSLDAGASILKCLTMCRELRMVICWKCSPTCVGSTSIMAGMMFRTL